MPRVKKVENTENELLVRAMLELERRKKADPLKFVEAPNDKVVEFWSSTAKTRGIFGGNRSGKSENACIDTLWHLRGDHPYQKVPPAPVAWRCEVSDYNQLEKVVLPKIARLCPPSLFKGGNFEKSYNNRTHIMSFSNGSKLDFTTHDQNVLSLEGAALNGVWFDEEPPYDHFISNMMRTVDYGGRLTLSLTPLQGLTWVYNEVYLKSFSNPNIFCTIITIYENRFLPKEAIAEVEGMIADEVDREIRLKGMFRPLGGLVFRKFNPSIHVYNEPNPYWDNDYPPAWWPHIVGIDPGWDHPTGVVWLAIDPESGEHWFYSEHKQSEMHPDQHSEIIHQRNEHFNIRPKYVIDSQANAKDHTGNQLITLYQKNGIRPSLGTKKLLIANMHLDELMRYKETPFGTFETSFHVSSDCPEFIKELSTYQRRVVQSEINTKEEFIDKNNDLIAAARYAAWLGKSLDFDYVPTKSTRKTIKTGY